MKIYKHKYYLHKSHPGISGFQQWDKTELRVCTGIKAKNSKIDIIAEFQPEAKQRFRLENGRCPEFQPIVDWENAKKFLNNEPYQMALIL